MRQNRNGSYPVMKRKRKMSAAQDAAMDRRAGIKPGSARDNALDRQRGVPTKTKKKTLGGKPMTAPKWGTTKAKKKNKYVGGTPWKSPNEAKPMHVRTSQRGSINSGPKVVSKRKTKKNKATGPIKHTGSFNGKSNALGHGGRAAQMRARGVPGGVIGAIARSEGAAPGGPNYHGPKPGRKGKKAKK